MKIIGKIVKLKLKIEKLTTGKTEKLKSQVRQITPQKLEFMELEGLGRDYRAESLDSEDSATDSQVAEKLFQVLKGKKFLLLLDDVWENIDLQAVGIPDPSGNRFQRGSLETFFKQVGGIIDLPEIQPFSRAIVEGCGGLPLLIIVTGSMLPPSEEEWRQAKMIFLMDNDLCTLPEKPNCPELSQLFMQRNSKLRVIRTSFFDLMTSLTVLNLSRNRIRSMPKTFFKLINLEILILRYCERLHVLPSEVGFLERLEVLDLKFSTAQKKTITEAILKALARSTVFYLDYHLGIWNLLEFGVSNINRLKFCTISECPNIETILECNELTEAVFPILENLSMHDMWNLTSLWEGIVPAGSFAELRILTVQACPKLKYVFSRFMSEFMPNLEELTVEDCLDMEEIILEDKNIIDSDHIALPILKKLKLHYLPGLVNIWRSGWPSLELINIYGCPRLKKIIGKDSKLKHRKMEIQAEESGGMH
ncbi:hypothetical protein Pint_26072 [Pistacia integerrima]|uniref:Uncharacterized protein n=1 Tax=Pistacia integerrima TaxID=434235 RepID=A0ACC0YEE7_9ROSI|nr:hypothetical protein Pint_26072 [Pistacia integerrima]